VDGVRLTLAIVLLAQAARAEPVAGADVARAREQFRLGRDHYERGEFDAAAHDFEAAYGLQPQPLLLYNLGQSARRGGHPDKAVEYYRRYLAAVPAAAERAEVEGYIAELSRLPPPSRPRSRRGLWIGVGVGGGLALGALVVGLSVGLGGHGPTLGSYPLTFK
jgi:tetratricopeptide (TPR) repeat protein